MPDLLLIATKGTRLAWINGRPFLFVAERQALCALEPDAAELWASFERGLPEGRAEPYGNGARIAADLASVGAIEPLSSIEGVAPVGTVETLAFGNVTVLLAFTDEALRDAMMPAFAHLRVPPRMSDEQVVILRQNRRIGVARRNEPITWAKPDEAVPLLRIAVTEMALERIEGLALHAAVVLRRERAMLLLGESGAGKSTLSLGLHCAGFALAGDDVADLRFDGTVRAAPFAITLKRGAWQLFESRLAEVAAAEIHRRADGKKARYLPIDTAAAAAPREVGWIVLLDRQAGADAAIAPLSPAETFAALLKSAWSGSTDLDPDGFAGLAACIDGARCVRLTYSDLDAATAALERLCNEDKG